MKILIISHSLPPQVNPRALRWGLLAQEFQNQGAEVHIVTSPLNPSKNLNFFVYPVGRGLDRMREKSRSNHSVGLRRIYRNFVRPLMWPDYACTWIQPAVTKAIELHEQLNFNAIITSSHPYSAHIVGQKIKQAYPQLFWMMDIGDPFFLLKDVAKGFFLYQRKNRLSEEQCLKLADAISVTNEGLREAYLQWLPELEDKISVIGPVLRDEIEKEELDLDLDPNWVHIGYAGTLYPKLRSPQNWLDLLERIRSKNPGFLFTMHFAGNLNGFEGEIQKLCSNHPDYYRYHGQLSPGSCQMFLESMSVLLNLGNTSPLQLPSKVVEAMATGKPIVHWSFIARDTSQQVLSSYPKSLVLSNQGQPEELVSPLLDFLQTTQALSQDEVDPIIQEYKAEKITQKYLDHLSGTLV